MRLKIVLMSVLMLAMAGCATAGGYGSSDHAAASFQPPENFQKVSALTALPEFLPGLGTLYVDPSTLPAGLFLAYDRDGTFVSTIYMIPLDDMNAHQAFKNLKAFGHDVVQVSLMYNAGHPGVAEPHYHIILWHVPPAQADLK